MDDYFIDISSHRTYVWAGATGMAFYNTGGDERSFYRILLPDPFPHKLRKNAAIGIYPHQYIPDGRTAGADIEFCLIKIGRP